MSRQSLFPLHHSRPCVVVVDRKSPEETQLVASSCTCQKSVVRVPPSVFVAVVVVAVILVGTTSDLEDFQSSEQIFPKDGDISLVLALSDRRS